MSSKKLREKDNRTNSKRILSSLKVQYLSSEESNEPRNIKNSKAAKEDVSSESFSENSSEYENDNSQSKEHKSRQELPTLKELNYALEDSSDESNENEMSLDLKKKRGQPDKDEEIKVQQHFLLRKRDIKGNYKAKFNLEKLIIEHERKQIQLNELKGKRQELQDQLSSLRSEIGKKVQSGDQGDIKTTQAKSHWDFLLKEMVWMAEDFEREHKKKIGDSKKQSRMCKKQLHEKKLKKEKEQKDMKVEVKKKAKSMANIVQLYWKSVEKIVKHNYNVLYEKKRQQIRAKKLESFVSKHLKLSVKVAEELNTKSFIEQSMYQKEEKDVQNQTLNTSESEQVIIQQRTDGDNIIQGENQTKRRKVTVMVKKDKDGLYDVDEEYEKQQAIHSQVLSQQDGGDMGFSRTKIAEQTVEMAKSFQPTGFTLSSVKVKTKVPFLLQGSLREYQIIGLDWMVTLHNKKLNGILADEMGLGKTIQTISLLASLACDKGIWGPHLIVVPTTIIINWEMEFKKWCPAFKILTYFGSQKERKMKRHGWSKDNSFHVCITSYKLVIQDHFAFRRKKWYYMVLDEAQNIKNFKSQRWQTLLRFNTKRRLLLTGTPLQNDVMELWSLMHFLMPNIFSSQQDFKEWFSNPFNQSVNHNQSLNLVRINSFQLLNLQSVVQKLQSILRPFLLRRMKREVEKQLPEKIEHVIPCQLSRRQRLLYDEYINSDKTKQTLSDTDFFSIMNVLMQLRKVCNHPDLFEPRTIESPFIMQERLQYNFSTMIYKALQYNPLENVNMKSLNFVLSEFESISQRDYQKVQELYPQRPLIQVIEENKNHIENLGDFLMDTRPTIEGYAIGKKVPINCNVLTKANTRSLHHTLPAVMPFESNIYHQIPNYINSACLPFTQHYYSLNSFDEMRYSSRNKEYTEFDTYISALHDEESKQRLMILAQKLIQWREFDQMNRTNLIFKKPVYGEDCRNAIKINLLFSDIFDVKRHKNLDRYNKNDITYIQEQENVPSTIINPFATLQQEKEKREPNIQVYNWESQTEEQIEQQNSHNSYIKEIPMSQQIKNKKKKQQQLQQMQQLKQPSYQIIPMRIPYTEKQISLIINIQNAKQENNDNMQDDFQNPNVEVKIEEITKEKIEMRKIEIRQIQDNEDRENSKNEDSQLESPYQRFYQNASKRYKRDQNDNDSKDQNMEDQEEVCLEEIKQDQLQNGIVQDHSTNLSSNQQQLEKKDVEMKISSQNDSEQQDSQKYSQKENGKNENQEEEDYMEYNNQKQDTENEKNLKQITYKNCEYLKDFIITPLQRVQMLEETIKQFKIIIPKVVAQPVNFVPTQIVTQHEKDKAYERFAYQKLMSHRNVNQSLKYSNILFFPHKNLIQYDCGKLQQLAQLLKHLHSKGSKILIFTQMTRVLDILENFLNLHGYTYVRLDGSVKVEMRQKMVDKFNLNKKIFCFISSTRCGGIGINLTGADCVIFYDSDWNPAMDKQAQDRCHRIGQTKTVNIYRLISTNTIEENIFKKSLQKRELGGLIIEGNFDMEFFKKVSLKDILDDDTLLRPKKKDLMKEENIVFHAGVPNNYEAEESNEINLEKQREIEQYRKRFEEALVKIEDKEDVIALQQAKREIDEEFDEEALQQEGGTTKADTSTMEQNNNEQESKTDETTQINTVNQDSKTAQGLYKEMKRSEFINWRTHPTLNESTKQSIGWFEENYTFDQYLDDRSKKDTKFVHPLDEEDEDKKKEQNEEDDEENESEFSLSDEDEEMSQNNDPLLENWDRKQAEQIYSLTRNEIESKYFVI